MSKPWSPAAPGHASIDRQSEAHQPIYSIPSQAEPRSAKPDWILLLLPSALSIKNFYAGATETGGLLIMAAFAGINGVLLLAAFLRTSDARYHNRWGPLLVMFASMAIVLSRPSGINNLLVFLLVGALAFQLARTVDARRIISSLVDGLGFYALLNVVSYMLGLRSPTEAEGWRLYLMADGASRIIFPLDQRLNLPPVLAAMYIAALIFLIREPGRARKIFRCIYLIAAVAILVGSGTRVPAVLALALPIMALLIPAFSRWVPVVAVAFASVSAAILPTIVAAIGFLLNPLVSAVSGRRDSYESLGALNGRDYVWQKAISYWQSEVTDLLHTLFGFGLYGHYSSGVSLTYYKLLSHAIVRDPEKTITVHNSFLQQLYDGGIAGWVLLTVALAWTAVRLSSHFRDWGNYAAAAGMAFTVVILCSMTEVLLHGTVITSFVLLVIVAAACQARPQVMANANSRRRPLFETRNSAESTTDGNRPR